MNFYDRYAQVCADRDIDPCSQKTAELFGVTRATISTWNTKGITPKGDTVAAIATALRVSTDYLLGRTDDPTDYSARSAAGALTAATVAGGVHTNKESVPDVVKMYNLLDAADKLKVEGIIQGLLLADKYKKQKNLA